MTSLRSSRISLRPEKFAYLLERTHTHSRRECESSLESQRDPLSLSLLISSPRHIDQRELARAPILAIQCRPERFVTTRRYNCSQSRFPAFPPKRAPVAVSCLMVVVDRMEVLGAVIPSLREPTMRSSIVKSSSSQIFFRAGLSIFHGTPTVIRAGECAFRRRQRLFLASAGWTFQ